MYSISLFEETPFTLTMKGKMSKEKVDECHRAVTRFMVKGLHPFATVESPSFRYAKYNLD